MTDTALGQNLKGNKGVTKVRFAVTGTHTQELFCLYLKKFMTALDWIKKKPPGTIPEDELERLEKKVIEPMEFQWSKMSNREKERVIGNEDVYSL